MILAAKQAGVDCVKFQKSTVLERFNKKCLEKAYHELQKYAKEVGIYFSASAFDFNAVNFLAKINVPFFKVPSSDTGSLDFIEFMAKKRIPMVISTGMQDLMTIGRVYHTVKKYQLSDLIPAEVSEEYRLLMRGAAKAALCALPPAEVDSKGEVDNKSK